ncbi:hypothetical protein ACFQL1_23815 [Halomicroarcula sp. GCM10025709]|uniref:hypothetical protein n=1 Tax=Haloarcula TaxID=2237 RepID=UPI0024C39D69|nr:hypothetical protein [Halomicroarcula sp. YJ-61-S]
MATTQSSSQERTGLPYGTALIGIDTNGHEHRFAGAVADHRVFICDGSEVLEVHDLDALAAAGVLEPVTYDGEPYDATTPRAWIEAWAADCGGWSEVRLDESLVGQLVREVDG